MMRGAFLVDVIFGLAVLILGSVAVTQATAGDVQLAQSNKVMQCMERCLRTEGKSEKATCKSRCANISLQRRQEPDCMTVYKQCLQSCGTNKTCRSACKKRLMTCS
tara:strand:- start:52 stop:369 length:318 start_codon:yes stop_codon:yes gene_type:complete